jgi:hypothetical protein
MQSEISIESVEVRSSYSTKGEVTAVVAVLLGWLCIAGLMTSGFYVWA